MAGAMAREGDMLSGHGSFPPHPFPVGGSIAKDAFIEGVKILCVGSIDKDHPSSVSPNPAPTPPPKIDSGSPTVKVIESTHEMPQRFQKILVYLLWQGIQ